ncbi:hypothetical protein [Nocardia sp. NPDC005366]|uniref:hypothetical protein n=1 Tax=Nocardia sp. NPDC005366 TaxID=3156878 RepID=UPI0033B8FEC0
MESGRPLAAVIRGVQAISGLAIGALTGFYVFPWIVYKPLRAFGLTDHDGPARTVGYWTSWIVVFMVLSGVCIAAAVNKHSRWFGVAATASFAPIALMVATVFIALDSY